MQSRQTLSIVLACFLGSGYIGAQPAPSGAGLQMSSGLRELFRAEMRQLLTGTRTIAESLPMGNWEGIAASAAAMRDSYVLEKKLTKAQEAEIAKLPERFRVMDEAFHLRAEKVIAAAKANDAEAVSFQFSRLLDTCVSCHSSYAASQFPNLESHPAPANH